MKVIPPDNPVWFDTLFGIESGSGTSIKSIPLSLEISGTLPEGVHSVEVILIGPDGVQHSAIANLEVRHTN